MLINIVKKIVAKFVAWLKPEYKYAYSEDLPEKVDNHVIYIIGDSKEPWLIAFICPCGCGELINLNLLKDADPCWKYSISKNKISILPSVWRTTGCKSHFYLRKGKIDWALSYTYRSKSKRKRKLNLFNKETRIE